MAEHFSPRFEPDQPLSGMENADQYKSAEVNDFELVPPLTPEQFTAIFYEGGESAERAKAEIYAAFDMLRGKNNG